ncbi:hypothetical protein N7495_004824 [Penicillium taxi]|uniref:uncharacterized protein n=1 Tax=Penicillium taxi TaxID=168475 RepID=UPI0025453581|nr:uncharacterized protein N7495_004824 [Penicillium taxi]KAJ5900080.1 hypothetical protein N7495_004824 [Penicillium taxi]
MVLTRVIHRSVFMRWFWIDDAFIIAATICSSPLNWLMFPMKELGLGTNIWAVPYDDISKELELLYIAEVFYMIAETFTQLSFLTFFTRIFPFERYRMVGYALMGLSVCFGLSNTFVMIFQCQPVSYFWHGWTGEYQGVCININAFSWFKAVFQIVMDIAIISLPIWPLVHTQTTTRKKIQIALMFCTGFAALTLLYTSDSNTPAVYWSVVECDVAIICACMPTIPPVLRSVFPSFFRKEYESRTADRPRKDPQLFHLSNMKKNRPPHFSNSQTQLVEDSVQELPKNSA